MKNILSKPIATWTGTDLADLKSSGMAESQFLDFKQAPSARGGHRTSEGDWNSEDSRRELAKDVVAMANADGGILVLGAEESADKPPRIVDFSPFAKCHDVAKSLQQSLADIVDPFLVGLQCRGISIADDLGVVVVSVPSSIDAPHAVKQGKSRLASYVRRGDESRPMTMRDIQSMTFLSAQALNHLDETLSSRRTAFAEMDVADQGSHAIGYRVTVMPIRAKFRVRDIYERQDLLRFPSQRHATEGDRKYHFGARFDGSRAFRPTLRGAYAEDVSGAGEACATVLEEGLVEVVFLRAFPGERRAMPSVWLLADAWNAVSVADKIRSDAGFAGADLVVEIELTGRRFGLYSTDRPTYVPLLPLVAVGDSGIFQDELLVRMNSNFPRYRLGTIDGMNELMNELVSDIYRAGGSRYVPKLDFTGA